MLSMVDLVEAGTIDLPLAAYLAAAMRSGASLLVGARPGGAGKTTVMAALLNFLPNQTSIRAVGSQAALTEAQEDDRYGQTCYLAHEISPSSHYYAYIWGRQAQVFFSLAGRGHIIASNLHADTLAETQEQLCRENNVAPADVEAVSLKLYLHVKRSGGGRRQHWINRVYESTGELDHLIWLHEGGRGFVRQQESSLVLPEQEARYAEFLERLIHRDVHLIEEVRRMIVDEMNEVESYQPRM